ncbi:hypothetical protein BURPS305_4431 [Burkholderia pseudomallei 305]|nr:hypothetical protein BURPS305_4431 [Burkholderia pseudomallei 305]EEC36730.1 hypothetical protein BUC_1085 [Burkholderia pseudomallei 576]
MRRDVAHAVRRVREAGKARGLQGPPAAPPPRRPAGPRAALTRAVWDRACRT